MHQKRKRRRRRRRRRIVLILQKVLIKSRHKLESLNLKNVVSSFIAYIFSEPDDSIFVLLIIVFY